MDSTDVIFREISPAAGTFRFDARVAHAFDDMAARSIPLYAELQKCSAELCRAVCPEGGRIYDLGCSTGTTLLAISGMLAGRSYELIGVDASRDMLAICRAKLAHASQEGIELIHARAEEAELLPCDVAIMNYTLQFVAPALRPALLARIHAALRPGGALLLSEKTLPADQVAEPLFERLYHASKERAGYTRAEIERKKAALRGVLVPQSVEENARALRDAGFESCEMLFKSYHFTTFLALKT